MLQLREQNELLRQMLVGRLPSGGVAGQAAGGALVSGAGVACAGAEGEGVGVSPDDVKAAVMVQQVMHQANAAAGMAQQQQPAVAPPPTQQPVPPQPLVVLPPTAPPQQQQQQQAVLPMSSQAAYHHPHLLPTPQMGCVMQGPGGTIVLGKEE